MSVGENIRKCRKEKGFTQKKLGELSGINEVQIRQYELGKTNPKIETLKKIAIALDTDVTILNPSLLIDNSPFAVIERNHQYNKSKKESSGKSFSILDILNLESKKSIGAISEAEYKYLKDIAAKKEALIKAFNTLNISGKDKAIELIELLTKIPEYYDTTDK